MLGVEMSTPFKVRISVFEAFFNSALTNTFSSVGESQQVVGSHWRTFGGRQQLEIKCQTKVDRVKQ